MLITVIIDHLDFLSGCLLIRRSFARLLALTMGASRLFISSNPIAEGPLGLYIKPKQQDMFAH